MIIYFKLLTQCVNTVRNDIMKERGEKKFECIVIGGGAVGSGCARDLALRGVKTLLLEKNDFGSGTSGVSSGMIHGGVRYLLYDRKTTRDACEDSGSIAENAGHLIFRIPFIFPVLKDKLFPKIQIELIETFMKEYDRFSRLKGGKRHLRLRREEVLKLEPGLSWMTEGAITFDEWGIDVYRLCLLNALSAREHGAEIWNHHRAAGFRREGRRITGLNCVNELTGEYKELECDIILNAGGPWSSELAEMAGAEVKLRPAKGVHILFDRRIVNYAVVATAMDGREIFVQPHENISMLGTTDDDYFGDLDDIEVLNDEVEYLLASMERVLPRIREARITGVIAGIRPTLFDWGVNEDRLSRDFKVIDHAESDGIEGLATITGGKLADYRLMAEKAVDRVCEKLNRKRTCSACRTRELPLPGSASSVSAGELARKHGIIELAAERMICRYGTTAQDILESDEWDDQDKKTIICRCESISRAEIRHAVRHEHAATLEDISRRTRLGMGPCGGFSCSFQAAVILGEELEWGADQIKNELRSFLQSKWKNRRPVASRINLLQEQINRFIHLGTGALK